MIKQEETSGPPSSTHATATSTFEPRRPRHLYDAKSHLIAPPSQGAQSRFKVGRWGDDGETSIRRQKWSRPKEGRRHRRDWLRSIPAGFLDRSNFGRPRRPAPPQHTIFYSCHGRQCHLQQYFQRFTMRTKGASKTLLELHACLM